MVNVNGKAHHSSVVYHILQGFLLSLFLFAPFAAAIMTFDNLKLKVVGGYQHF